MENLPSHTIPSGETGRIPTGTPAEIRTNDDAETKRALLRENEAAITLAQAGYNVEQRPSVSHTRKRPDYRIEGQIFDCYAPASRTTAYNIIDTLARKVALGQTQRIILNLNDSLLSIEEIQQQLTANPIPDLLEIIAIKEQKIIPIFP